MATVAGVRRFGAASLDLAYVAAGRFDGYCGSSGLHAWDVAAGTLAGQRGRRHRHRHERKRHRCPDGRAIFWPPTSICIRSRPEALEGRSESREELRPAGHDSMVRSGMNGLNRRMKRGCALGALRASGLRRAGPRPGLSGSEEVTVNPAATRHKRLSALIPAANTAAMSDTCCNRARRRAGRSVSICRSSIPRWRRASTGRPKQRPSPPWRPIPRQTLGHTPDRQPPRPATAATWCYHPTWRPRQRRTRPRRGRGR